MKLENFTRDFRTHLGLAIRSCLGLVLLIAFTSQANAQCPLACNNLVQVSLDNDCIVEVTPDMMLEGQGTDPTCTYTVSVLGSNGLPIVGSPNVTSAHIGMTLTVKVNLELNSCWGTIKVEDKLAPVIDCPADLTISCYDNRTFSLPSATDNCGGTVTVKLLSNDLDDQGCNDEWSAVRTLKYQATDKSGNKSLICIRQIYYFRTDFEELEFPLNRDDVEAAALECDDIPEWDTNNNGYPDPTETGTPTIDGFNIFPNNSLCELNATFVDQRLDICANSFKVLRKWTVLDWCSGELAEDFQIIKVIDKEKPIVTCAPDQTQGSGFSVNSDPYTCTATWEVPAPIVIYDCGKTTWKVDYLLADSNGAAPVNGIYINDNVKIRNGKVFIDNLPVGRTWIRYTITDACGNFEYCFTEVDVVDNIPPVAVCDEFTVVTLTTGGVAQIFALTFDDGSHDNCTDVTFDARRMTAGCGASTVNWTTAVNFCCDDVGKDVMVSLRVTDKNGNSNTCMVIVRTQDKIDPKITCPPNITINCDQDAKDFTLTGRPTAIDNCGTPTITNTDGGSLNQCNVGTIARTWRATDAGGRSASCTQQVVVRNNFPFKGSDINWNPVSGVRTLNGCMDIDTDPSKTGKPTWTSDICDLIASTYSDQVFTVVDSACFKILRTWTIIDWCTFDQNNPGAGGIWSYTQVIKLNNTVKPTFAACADVTVCAYGENCDGFVELKQNATDDCTPADKLVWKYEVDFNNDGSIDKRGNNNDASATYKVGKHKITWRVEDKCGNIGVCTYFFTVKDCKKPTPYCLSEITTVIMPSSGNIDIWASDFDKGSFDNCPGKLKISFSQTVTDIKRTFTCNNLGLNPLDMWVTDSVGNKEFCSVKINIQANPGACGTSAGNLVEGNVGTEQNKMVANASVSLASNETMILKTNNDGKFAFSGLVSGKEYKITTDLNENHSNGVSTLDLVMIQRHILGAQKLTSPYNIIAADANNDQKVSANDLVELRKLILGVTTKLPNNKSWRFINAAHVFADPTKPWNANEAIIVNYNGTSISNLNFKAVKIGDVNANAATNAQNHTAEPRSSKRLEMEIAQQSFEKGSRIVVPVYASNAAEIAGIQFSMKYDNSKVKMIGVVPASLTITDDNINNIGDLIVASWAGNENTSVKSNDELFSLVFETLQSGEVNNIMSLNDKAVKTEAYNSDLEVMNVELSYRKSDVSNGVTLMQNTPNPFDMSTTIQFTLPEAQAATLTVFDIAGKAIYTKQGNFAKGVNQVTLTSNDISASGVMYYQLESKGYKSTKTMIKIAK